MGVHDRDRVFDAEALGLETSLEQALVTGPVSGD
jgi:hypothetical protein